MTTYKELFGKYVQNVASDPTSTDAEGQIWYNSTSGTFKTALGSFGVWAAGGSLNTSRGALAGAGTQTAGLAFGGYTTVGVGNTEKYNGTAWTNNPTGMNTARTNLVGLGIQTAALAFAGNGSPFPVAGTATESFNGSTWTSVNSMSSARLGKGGAGLQTAALGFGGYGPGVTAVVYPPNANAAV